MAKIFSYPIIARFWAVVFLIVGGLFAFMPVDLGVVLTGLAYKVLEALAFKTDPWWGVIDLLPGTLGHVLMLAYMAMIAVAAWLSAINPSHKEIYYVLLVGKCASTLGFAFFAYRETPAFWLCAAADGFVVLTLWLAGRKV